MSEEMASDKSTEKAYVCFEDGDVDVVIETDEFRNGGNGSSKALTLWALHLGSRPLAIENVNVEKTHKASRSEGNSKPKHRRWSLWHTHLVYIFFLKKSKITTTKKKKQKK